MESIAIPGKNNGSEKLAFVNQNNSFPNNITLEAWEFEILSSTKNMN